MGLDRSSSLAGRRARQLCQPSRGPGAGCMPGGQGSRWEVLPAGNGTACCGGPVWGPSMQHHKTPYQPPGTSLLWTYFHPLPPRLRHGLPSAHATPPSTGQLFTCWCPARWAALLTLCRRPCPATAPLPRAAGVGLHLPSGWPDFCERRHHGSLGAPVPQHEHKAWHRGCTP